MTPGEGTLFESGTLPSGVPVDWYVWRAAAIRWLVEAERVVIRAGAEFPEAWAISRVGVLVESTRVLIESAVTPGERVDAYRAGLVAAWVVARPRRPVESWSRLRAAVRFRVREDVSWTWTGVSGVPVSSLLSPGSFDTRGVGLRSLMELVMLLGVSGTAWSTVVTVRGWWVLPVAAVLAGVVWLTAGRWIPSTPGIPVLIALQEVPEYRARVSSVAVSPGDRDVARDVERAGLIVEDVDLEWVRYITDPEAAFLRMPLLRDPGFPEAVAYRDALFAAREAVADFSGDALVLAVAAEDAWNEAKRVAGEIGCDGFGARAANDMARMAKLLTGLRGAVTDGEARGTVEAIRRVMDGLEVHYRPDPVMIDGLGLSDVARRAIGTGLTSRELTGG